MNLSDVERRELARIDHYLSDDPVLRAVSGLFADGAGPNGHGGRARSVMLVVAALATVTLAYFTAVAPVGLSGLMVTSTSIAAAVTGRFAGSWRWPYGGLCG